MGIRLYSNAPVKKLIRSMVIKGREPHSIVITGEKGQGKKALARYIGAALLCETKNGEPCGKCKSCRMIERGVHPDFIMASSNENGNYQVDAIREIVSDAVVRPNEGRFKVYVIPDLDRSANTSTQVQNILLKLIEEPPEHCIIILTAAAKEIFLETVISRVLCLNTFPCSEEDSRAYLSENFSQASKDDTEKAIAFGAGNIGRCIEYLNDSSAALAMEAAGACGEAIYNRSEYDLLKAFFMVDGKKALFRRTLELLSEAVGNSCILRYGIVRNAGGIPKITEKLARRLDSQTAAELYELLGEYIYRLDVNANLTLCMNSLSARIFELIQDI